jgi:hypothetical protein
VLNYARGQQFDLLRALGFEAPSWQDLASLLIGLLCAAGAGRRRLGLVGPPPAGPLAAPAAARAASACRPWAWPCLPHHGPRTRALHGRPLSGSALFHTKATR